MILLNKKNYIFVAFRHETYKHQYRAMFVMNCIVDRSETLQYPEQAPKKKKHKKKTSQTAEVPSSETDLFNPVSCAECNTVVGVIDHDEVYHFFNILASHTWKCKCFWMICCFSCDYWCSLVLFFKKLIDSPTKWSPNRNRFCIGNNSEWKSSGKQKIYP